MQIFHVGFCLVIAKNNFIPLNFCSNDTALDGNSGYPCFFCLIGLLCRLNYRLWGKITICVCVTLKCQSKGTWVHVAEGPASSQRTKDSTTMDLFVHNKQTQLCHREHLFVTVWKAWNSCFDCFPLADNKISLQFYRRFHLQKVVAQGFYLQ